MEYKQEISTTFVHQYQADYFNYNNNYQTNSFNYYSSNIPKPTFYPNYYPIDYSSNNASNDNSFENSFNSYYSNASSSINCAYSPQYAHNYSPIFSTYSNSPYQTGDTSCIKVYQKEQNDSLSAKSESKSNKRQRSSDTDACQNSRENKPMKDCKRHKVIKLENLESTDVEFNCTTCKTVFYSAAKLLMHEFVHHKNGNSKQCPVCYRDFGSNSNAMVHLRGHTQEKLYQCNQCDKSFVDISTLKKHKRTHSGEKPYECNLCTRKFSQSGNLSRHLLTHTKQAQVDKTSKESTVLNVNHININGNASSYNYHYNNLSSEQLPKSIQPQTEYYTAFNYCSKQYQNL